MFGIGGGEIVFILLIVLMLFGSDKVPEIARTLGKIMANLKNATNEIKSEIQKGVDDIQADTSISDITKELNQAKKGLVDNGTSTVNQIKDDFENTIGSIKRQL